MVGSGGVRTGSSASGDVLPKGGRELWSGLPESSQEVVVTLLALLVPVLAGLFMLVMERLERELLPAPRGGPQAPDGPPVGSAERVALPAVDEPGSGDGSTTEPRRAAPPDAQPAPAPA
jgi:hypothetical protein